MTNNPERHSIARRDVLKKTAAVGAIAWTAPVIMSSRVFAQDNGSPGGGPLCERVYVFKLEGGCVTATPKFCNDAIYAEALETGLLSPGESIYLPDDLSQVVIGGSCSGGDDNQGSFTLQEGFTAIAAIGKKASNPVQCNVVPVSGGPTYTTGVDGSGNWQSHVYILVCGPDGFGDSQLPHSLVTAEEMNAALAQEEQYSSFSQEELGSGDVSNDSKIGSKEPAPSSQESVTTTTVAPTTTEATTTTVAPTTTEATTTTAAPEITTSGETEVVTGNASSQEG